MPKFDKGKLLSLKGHKGYLFKLYENCTEVWHPGHHGSKWLGVRFYASDIVPDPFRWAKQYVRREIRGRGRKAE